MAGTPFIEYVDINVSNPDNRLPCLFRSSNDLLNLVSHVWGYQIVFKLEEGLFCL